MCRTLQVAGQVSKFLRDHLGHTIPSPAVLERIGTAFRHSVSVFAADEHVPVVHFGKDDRKIEVMRRYLAAQAATGRSGVAAIGVAQEFQNVFAASKRQDGTAVWFSFYKADRRVTCFYFYVWDEQFGPAFIKVCSYFPYPIKVWVNGAFVTHVDTIPAKGTVMIKREDLFNRNGDSLAKSNTGINRIQLESGDKLAHFLGRAVAPA